MQVALQQTPSMHLFEPHSAAAAQTLPFGFSPVWQVPAASQYDEPLHGAVAIVSCADEHIVDEIARWHAVVTGVGD